MSIDQLIKDFNHEHDIESALQLMRIDLKHYRGKKYLCPFHSEKTGSFHIENNKAKCFGCGVSLSSPYGVLCHALGIEESTRFLYQIYKYNREDPYENKNNIQSISSSAKNELCNEPNKSKECGEHNDPLKEPSETNVSNYEYYRHQYKKESERPRFIGNNSDKIINNQNSEKNSGNNQRKQPNDDACMEGICDMSRITGRSRVFVDEFIDVLPQNILKREKQTFCTMDNAFHTTPESIENLLNTRKITKEFQEKFGIGYDKKTMEYVIPQTRLDEGIQSIIRYKKCSDPKYKFSAGSKKSEVFFGEPQAEASILESKKIIITEGVFDCITAHQFGYSNTVAMLGFDNPEKLLEKAMRLGVREIILALDHDEAGKNNTLNIIKYFNNNIKKYLIKNNAIQIVIGGVALLKLKDIDEELHEFGTLRIVNVYDYTLDHIAKETNKTFSEYNQIHENILNFHQMEELLYGEKEKPEIKRMILKDAAIQIEGKRNNLEIDSMIEGFDIGAEHEEDVDCIQDFSLAGIKCLDRYIKYKTGTCIILAGDTGTGKTTFSCLTLLHNQFNKDIVQLFVSIEMSATHVKEKLYKYIGAELAKKNEKSNILIVSSPANLYSIIDIIRHSKQTIKKDKKMVVYIDHIHSINFEGSASIRPMDIIAKMIVAVTKDLDILTIALSQVTRENAKTGCAPMIHDLKESGSLEQGASVVLGIHDLCKGLLLKRKVNSPTAYRKSVG